MPLPLERRARSEPVAKTPSVTTRFRVLSDCFKRWKFAVERSACDIKKQPPAAAASLGTLASWSLTAASPPLIRSVSSQANRRQISTRRNIHTSFFPISFKFSVKRSSLCVSLSLQRCFVFFSSSRQIKCAGCNRKGAGARL